MVKQIGAVPGIAKLAVGCLLILSVGLFILIEGCGDDTSAKPTLTVYCAAGVRKPVEKAAAMYEQEYGVKIRLDYGSSGELEGKLKIDKDDGRAGADIYIPADQFFASRAKHEGLLAESIELATFRLVLAVKPESNLDCATIDELLESEVPFVLCQKDTGAGKRAYDVLNPAGKWDPVDKRRKATLPRVTEAASAIKTSADIQAGIIWNTTAAQFELKALDLEELQNATSKITANIVESSQNPTEALRFARYLAAPSKGQQPFARFDFEPVNGDRWAKRPELVFFCGGVNREAVQKTLDKFMQREGCDILVEYGGCGSLVAAIEAASGGDSNKAMPGVFMTCDASYMDKVQPLFGRADDVSSTAVVMLVRSKNPWKIESIEDLAQPGLKIGTTDPEVSTLGHLSHRLLEMAGIYDTIQENESIILQSPSAHELLLQMTTTDKLDVVMVYRANCNHLSSEFELVRVEYPEALAVQNIAIGKQARYPALSRRLVEALRSAESKQRFEGLGFQWRANPDQP